jgi:hypothetical protein hcinC1_01475
MKHKEENPAWYPQYKQFKNKPVEAIKHLMKVKKGDCLQALYRKDIGYIDIVWGENDKNNKGFGLKHIIEKHGDEIKQLGFKVEVFIPIIVQFGELKKSDKPKRIELVGEMFKVVIKTEFREEKSNKRIDKKFILTAFDLRPLAKKKKSKGN